MDTASLSALGLPTRAATIPSQQQQTPTGHAHSGPQQQQLRQSASGSSSRAGAMSTKDWASNFWITLVDENGESG
jgi:hypothetical protein